MKTTRTDLGFRIPVWWYILPAYLTLWTVAFSLYSYADGNGMMEAFGIDTGGASDFIMLNSAGRYIALGVAMIAGVWVFRSYYSMLTALLARLSMDVVDLIAGLQTGTITDLTGVLQSAAMFLIPNIISIYLLIRFHNQAKSKNNA